MRQAPIRMNIYSSTNELHISAFLFTALLHVSSMIAILRVSGRTGSDWRKGRRGACDSARGDRMMREQTTVTTVDCRRATKSGARCRTEESEGFNGWAIILDSPALNSMRMRAAVHPLYRRLMYMYCPRGFAMSFVDRLLYLEKNLGIDATFHAVLVGGKGEGEGFEITCLRRPSLGQAFTYTRMRTNHLLDVWRIICAARFQVHRETVWRKLKPLRCRNGSVLHACAGWDIRWFTSNESTMFLVIFYACLMRKFEMDDLFVKFPASKVSIKQCEIRWRQL